MSVPPWFAAYLGWKPASSKTKRTFEREFGTGHCPNLADMGNLTSAKLAAYAYDLAGVPRDRYFEDLGLLEQDAGTSGQRASLGNRLEHDLAKNIQADLERLAPGRQWQAELGVDAADFTQYEHLALLQKLYRDNPQLAMVVGRDYQVSTDVMVGLPDRTRSGRAAKVLHAAVSSKLTIRSDRVQNIRFEFSTLVRNRQGRLPHLVVVTAEPLPSRLASIARGTGEIDAVYHLLFDELDQAVDVVQQVRGARSVDQRRIWKEVTSTRRLRPYSELAATLAAS